LPPGHHIKEREEEDMPFIDSKITLPVDAPKKEVLKSKLGKLITTLNKSETYLMVGIEDGYDLWLGGKKLKRGEYVSVSLFGNAPKSAYDKLTGQICDLFAEELDIPGNNVYVTYHPVSDWGWNGGNF
jgi:phenylpyruvate tautomerase PptA (4-oxalocrotonate tautomerase family)